MTPASLNALRSFAADYAAGRIESFCRLRKLPSLVAQAPDCAPCSPSSFDGCPEPYRESYAAKSGERWITINSAKGSPAGEKGGMRIKIDARGKIISGPAAIQGKNINSFGKKSEPKTESERTIRDTAKEHRHSQSSLAAAIEDVYKLRRQETERREEIRKRAGQLLGMNAGDIARHENGYRDHSSIPGFDEAASSLSLEYPEEFGAYGSDSDHSQKLWEFMRHGKQAVAPKFSREVIDSAVEMLNQQKSAAREERRATRERGGDISFDFGANAKFSMSHAVTLARKAVYSMKASPS